MVPKKVYDVIYTVACAEFILAGAEKKSGGAESRPKYAKKISAPPAEPTRGGAEIKRVILYLKTGFKRSFQRFQV